MINKLKHYHEHTRGNRLLGIFLSASIALIFFAIFQDFLHSIRNGYSFFFSESLLFKTFWIFFPPILFLLRSALKNRQIKTIAQMCVAVIVPTLGHLILVPLTVWFLSVVFFDNAFGFFKVFTYTLSNDLVKALLIYGIFIFLHKYLGTKFEQEIAKKQTSVSQHIVVTHGKNYTRLKLSEILYIRAATPYIAIQLEKKQFLHSETLKSIVEKLDTRFIRVHKSSIVNIDKVISYKSRLNGDYDLMLQDGTELRLSRNYIYDFRNNFGSGPQLNP